ncbi:hypothetical protein HBI56_213240 [Parastagonospora nodorum]|nr:hypothetical protein HBH56_228840 [Parastagonospora nodorum]KAH3921818.1 hypothetical protein HBH54_233920 [Parastagonospora nodorum]KAH3960905.1 hypothetical protein HBH52_234120 [Parastagonospora nodorum]KAH3963040.1 hypothetical protein HBH51_171510 [Parastagonospora nodorum]KAH3991798.1 hypothetical protein HBI10_226270 [Parastagonospora nodorum]
MDRSVVRSRDIQLEVQSGQKWVGGSRPGPRRHSEREGLSARAGGHSVLAAASGLVVVAVGQSTESWIDGTHVA